MMEQCSHKYYLDTANEYQVDVEGFLHFKNRIYVPNQYSIKQVIFKELHDNLYARHPGYQKFITSLK